MSSVDRKRGRDWDDDDEGDDSTAVVQSRRRLPFMLRKRAIYNQNLTKVNQWMNRLIQKYLALIGEPLPRNVKPSEERIEDLDHTTMLFQEYLRIQKEIEDLYNRPAGDVVFMGSNEFSLFRLKDETEETESEVVEDADADDDDDDDVKEYPPTIHKRLPSGKFIQVAVGGMHTAALTADGQVYTWGDEQNGALARESNAADWVVTGFRNRGTCYDDEENEDGQIVAIQAGESFTTFQTINGNVYTSGMYKCDNLIFHDVLWDPSNPVDPKGPNKEPIHILMDQKVRLIAAGGNMNAALFADGCTLVTWGVAPEGQLARSAQITSPDEKGNYDLTKLVKESDEDFIVEKFLTPAPVIYGRLPHERKSVLSVACGFVHMLVVARDPGSYDPFVYGAGDNSFGALGLGVEVDKAHELTLIPSLKDKNIVKVAAGGQFSLALDHYQIMLYSFGRSDYGQLGLFNDKTDAKHIEYLPRRVSFPGTKTIRIKDIAVSDISAMAFACNGDVYTWGAVQNGITGHMTKVDVTRPQKLPLDSLAVPGKQPIARQGDGGGQFAAMIVSFIPKEPDETSNSSDGP